MPQTSYVTNLTEGLFKHSLKRPDGRPLYLYSGDSTPIPQLAQDEARTPPTPHMRYHALRGQWVMVASHRQDRTFFPPPEYNPLAPTLPGKMMTEVPYQSFGIAVFENKFPSLAPTDVLPDIANPPSQVAPGDGICEVVVYDADANTLLREFSLAKLEHLMWVWRDRVNDLGSRASVDYVLIFENRGEDVGVTLHHPHGQIYAYPFIPPYLVQELEQVQQHGDILGKLVAHDLADKTRLVYENDNWAVLVPFWARYPFETYTIPKALHTNLTSLSHAEMASLAAALNQLTGAYDRVFDKLMPYVMAIQQAPKPTPLWDNYRMRIEILPRLRTETKLKFLAGTEVAAGAFAVDALAEDYAQTLRDALS
jgi:UDPglucose--hexose-1-phosphate uridylyltransferase